jgi:ATP-binding cassette subfamily B protein
MDCGPTCLRMIAKYHGRNFSLQTLRNLCDINKAGVSILGISVAAESIGFRSTGVKISNEKLEQAPLPAILHWRQKHFVVLYKIKNNKYYIADPADSFVKLSQNEFNANWHGDKETNTGIALLLLPAPLFYEQEDDTTNEVKWSFLVKYLATYKKLILQMLFGLVVGSILQLITPFLTQSIVDIGINTHNLNFIQLILIAQMALIVGRVSVEFIRSWILLHVSTRINISILTDFFIKLMKLPMGFFDNKNTGDILQRMNDQHNIETFLTGSTLSIVFAMFNLIIFSIVLASYKMSIFFVFVISSVIYIVWILLFLKQQRTLNYKSFEVSAKNQSSIVQLIGGMQEIKLNNCEQEKRWEWEHIQARLFRFNVKSLSLSQYQQGGATLINEGKNILITFLSAEAVITGNLTLGAMVAIQYIAGQLNSPIEQLLNFVKSFQEAKISMERLNDIHQLEDEEPVNQVWSHSLPENKSLKMTDLNFSYPGAGNRPVLKNITLFVPQGKTTAIVGMSGSGKTTILKLLLRFYEPQSGKIEVGGQLVNNIGFKTWRSNCGVVMQDGFIFSDTIEKNISVGDEFPNKQKLNNAIKIANIQEFIDSLPLGLNTKIGAEGVGLSQGQRQRMLIARAVYKEPEYIFFDEATNALDSNNEKIIMNHLNEFFVGRTVIIVAHRLSTVSKADNIIVLSNGDIIEQGTHSELISSKGSYFDLVKDQLELGA